MCNYLSVAQILFGVKGDVSVRNFLKYSLIPILLLVIFLFFYKFPNKVEVVRSAGTFSYINSSTFQETHIQINGILYRPLFRDHVFKGSIIINGNEVSENGETLDTYILEKKNGINMGNLVYNDLSKNPPDNVSMLGIIWFDDDFNNITILDVQTKVRYIVTGSTYKDALSTLEKMKKDFGSSFVVF